MRLWSYLSLVVGAVILLAFLCFGAYSASEQSARHLRSLQSDSRNIARSLAAGTADDLVLQNLDKLEDQLLRHAAISTLDELLIADPQGALLVRVKRTDASGFQVVYTGTPLATPQDASEQLDGHTFSTMARIERGQLLGWVRVTTDLSGMQALRLQIWRDAVLTSLLSALVAGAALACGLRHAARDLARACNFAADLKHQHGAHLPAHSPILELRQLQHALDLASRELALQFRQVQDAEVRKRAIFEAVLDCIITFDTGGTLIDFNPAAERTFGMRRAQALLRHLSDIIVPPAQPCGLPFSRGHWSCAEPAEFGLVRVESLAHHSDGHLFPVELAVVAFESDGHTLLLASVRDISVRKALEAERERITALLQQTVSDLQVRQLALDEHAIIGITDPAGNIEYANQKFADVSQYALSELVGRNIRLLKSEQQDAGFFRSMWDSIGAGQVWHGELANRRKDGSLYWLAYTIVSILGEQRRITGYISIGTDITAQKLAERALADARQRELATGHEIQRALLLGDMPGTLAGAELATYTVPAQGVDGDFYAFTRFGANCFEVLLGDVMGKGVPAALAGAGIKSCYHQVLAQLLSERGSQALPQPAEIINTMHLSLTPRLIELHTFATLALYRFDLSAGSLTLVNAGHTPALLQHGAALHAVEGDNLPLGVLREEHYQQHVVALPPGARLFAYSDGISEAHDRNGAEFGVERLRQALLRGAAAQLPPPLALHSLRYQVRQFSGNASANDDQTALLVALTPPAAPGDAGQLLQLPWQLSALAALRGQLAAAASMLPEHERQALLLASFEAASNILRHAQPYFADPCLVCRLLPRHDGFCVELLYPAPAFTPPAAATPDFSGASEGGFGLYIMAQCVERVDYYSPAPGIGAVRLLKRRGAGLGAAA